jgi:ribose transport system substrate-binding protein
MTRSLPSARGTAWGWLVAALATMMLVAAACAPGEEEPEGGDDGGGQTTGTTDGPVELTDDFSTQHAEWATQTVDTSEFATEPPYRIATIVQGPTNGWGTIFDTVMNYELEQSDQIEDQLYVPWDFTTESQANGIDDAIAQDVDAILLTALSRAGLAEPVQRAVDAGIPVITCMATVEGDAPTVDVSRSIPLMGYESARQLAEALGGEGNVVLLHGIAGVDAAEFWRSGAMAAFEEYPGIEIVAEDYGQWSVADALDVMRGILTAQPQIDGVWVGGLEMGVSVVNAFQEAGRDLPVMAGTNPINGFLRLATENDIEFFAAPFPPAASQLCVQTMFQVLNGESVPRFIEVADVMDGTQPFGSDEAEERYQPQFNDDWIGPAVIPEEAYLEAGFGA